MNFNIKDIAKTFKDSKKLGKPIIIFTGAGCSKSAGMPLASELVNEINKKFKGHLKSLNDEQKKDYGTCMSHLVPSEQKNLIEKHISKAKINWAHIALASLLKNGYLGKILTFNFDDILSRACSLDNFYPPTYDLKVLSEEYFSAIPNQSIVHLHGQWSGFQLANSDIDTKKQAEKLESFIKNTINNSHTLFLGYSGGADAFFKLVDEGFIGQHRLFWVDYAKEPNNNVKKFIDVNPNHRNFIGEQDADRFLLELAIELKCFPTELFKDPIKHLKGICELVNQFPLPTSDTEIDILEDTKKTLEIADKTKPAIATIKLAELLHAKKFETIINQAKSLDLKIKPISKIVASAYLGKALSFIGKDDDQFKINFERALKINPNFHHAHLEVANIYLGIKKPKYNIKANKHFELFLNKVPNIKDSQIFEGYAISLTRLGKDNDDETYFTKSFEYFDRALSLDTSRANLFGNYSSSMSSLATRKNDSPLFDKALIYAKKALMLQPENLDLKTNYADILAAYGETISDEEKINDALSCYKNIIHLDENHRICKGNYNVTLARFSALKRDSKKFSECIKFLEEHFLDTERRDYNLACLYSLSNDFLNAKKLLLKAEKHNNLPSISHLTKDKDLHNVRNETWFIELLEHLKVKEETKKLA